MTEQAHEIVLATLDETVRLHPLHRKLVIDRLREDAERDGFNSSYRYWLSRWDDYFDPTRRHHLPPKVITYAIEVCGTDSFLDPWLALAAKVQRRERAYGEHVHDERFGPGRCDSLAARGGHRR